MRKIYSFLFLTFLVAFSAYSQTKKIDSLVKILNTYQPKDTFRVNILNSLALEYQNIDLDKAKSLSEEAEKISLELNYSKGLAYCLYNLGTYYWRADNFDTALVLCNRSLTIFNNIGLTDGKIKCLNRIAVIQMQTSNYQESIENYFKCLELCEETNNINQLGKIYNNIGVIYANLNDYQKAVEFTEKALKYKRQIDDSISYGISLHSRGRYYINLGSLDKGLKYSKESLKFNLKINNNYSIGESYQSLADIYDKKGYFDSAFIYHTKGLEVLENYGNKRLVGHSHYLLGNHHLLKKQFNKAINHANIALDIALENDDRNNILYSYNILYRAYAGLNDTANAYKYLSAYEELNNELKKKENIRRLAIEEKDFEFKLLKQKIDFEQQAALSKQKTAKNYFIAAFFLVFIIVIFISYALSQKVKSNRILKKANETRDKMFKIISHDLRSPLISIGNTLQLIPNFIKNKDYESAIRLSTHDVESVSRVLSLIDNLISWTLNQSDEIPYNPGKYNLQQISQFIFDLYAPVAKHKNIELNNTIPSNIDVFADKNILNTVLRNLINNAIKFTPENGNVTVSGKQNNNQVEISVSDTGIGIPKEQLHKIFSLEHEKRLGTKKERGNGLGLFFCKEFVIKNKGNIWVESEVGKPAGRLPVRQAGTGGGSTFYFTVPTYLDK